MSELSELSDMIELSKLVPQSLSPGWPGSSPQVSAPCAAPRGVNDGAASPSSRGPYPASSIRTRSESKQKPSPVLNHDQETAIERSKSFDAKVIYCMSLELFLAQALRAA